ncbi:MAG: ABC-F family ATP-binding cassette domain-containing protein [Flavobacteriales bacterium]|nr:ABC-F family ATP-binding cassette domain-containing protein [Flavobacteriales bacterium]
MDMIEQLEDELNAPNMTVLLVTHDRYFLDNVCDEIVEMEFGDFTRFKGNYSYYVEKKALLDDAGCHSAPFARPHEETSWNGSAKCLEHVARKQEPLGCIR